MLVDTDSGYELMIQDYNSFEVGSKVGLLIRPNDIQVMWKERVCNTFDAEVIDENHVNFCNEDFECNNLQGYEAGQTIKVQVAFDKVELLDQQEQGALWGEVHFILYKGDHYHLTILTDEGDFLYVDTNDIWDMGDLVGVNISADDIKPLN